jgi:hypothetical protein
LAPHIVWYWVGAANLAECVVRIKKQKVKAKVASGFLIAGFMGVCLKVNMSKVVEIIERAKN